MIKPELAAAVPVQHWKAKKMRWALLLVCTAVSGCNSMTLSKEELTPTAAQTSSAYTPEIRQTVEAGVRSQLANSASARFESVNATRSGSGETLVCGLVQQDRATAAAGRLFVAQLSSEGELAMVSVASNADETRAQTQLCRDNGLIP